MTQGAHSSALLKSERVTMAQEKYELPEICYDEPVPGRPANQFPFILVKSGKKMPAQMQREWQRVRKLTIAQYGMDVWSAILKKAMRNDEPTAKI